MTGESQLDPEKSKCRKRILRMQKITAHPKRKKYGISPKEFPLAQITPSSKYVNRSRYWNLQSSTLLRSPPSMCGRPPPQSNGTENTTVAEGIRTS